MKTIIIFICMVFACSPALKAQFEAVKTKTKEDYRLKGDVKQVIESRAKNKKILEFTPEGLLSFDGWSDSPHGITCTYDKTGRMLKYKMVIDVDNFLIHTYSYNTQGLLLKYISENEKKQLKHETYQYDINGKIHKVENRGKPWIEFRNTYDAQKRIIKKEQLSPSSIQVIETEEITYLPNGWSKRVSTTEMSETVLEIDNKGRMRSETHRDLVSGEIYISTATRYDDNDNLIEKRNGKLQVNYAYNTSGELLSYAEVGNNYNEDQSYTYTKHDEKGNWTERIFTNLNSNEQHTQTRDITYYEEANTASTNDLINAIIGKRNPMIPENGEFVASAPNTVAVGYHFRLNYTIGGDKISNFKAPAFDNFDLLVGPTTSTTTSTTAENGSKTSKSCITYTFFLQAVKEGSFTIPGATAELKGKSCKSNSVMIKVISDNTEVKGKTIQ